MTDVVMLGPKLAARLKSCAHRYQAARDAAETAMGSELVALLAMMQQARLAELSFQVFEPTLLGGAILPMRSMRWSLRSAPPMPSRR